MPHADDHLFTRDELFNIGQSVAEIATSLGPADWDAFPDRAEAVASIVAVAIELDTVTNTGGARPKVEWGATHDYYGATERCAERLVAFPGVPEPAEITALVLAAIDDSAFDAEEI